MAPDKPVVLHEPFRIQYIIDDALAENEFIAPDWDGFTIVTDKQVNKGFFQTQKGKTAITNIIYTLSATGTGIKLIQPATIIQGKQKYNCNTVSVNVVAAGSVSLPIPKNINNKLYLKLQVTKNKCYVGEPVLATYKLYSAVSTQTEITKNPAFIGFSAVNALPVQIKPAEYVTVNGIAYEVHTLAKSLLFPLQYGNYTVDKMEVYSKVYPEDAMPGLVAADSFEVSSVSNAASVEVKALPDLDNNDNYYGGVGSFNLSAYWNKNRLKRNETGSLIVRLQGTGNFTQITAPEFQWPEGLNSFSPEVKDSVNVTASGRLTGARYFVYPFKTGKSGIFLPDTIQFTYFDPVQKKYVTLKARPDVVKVSNEKYIHGSKTTAGVSDRQQRMYHQWLLVGMVIIVVAILLGWRLINKRRSLKKNTEIIQPLQQVQVLPEPDISVLLPLVIEQRGKEFYIILKQQVIQLISDKMKVPLNNINTIEALKATLSSKAGNDVMIALAYIITTCNEKIYSQATAPGDEATLLQQANNALEKLVEIVPERGK